VSAEGLALVQWGLWCGAFWTAVLLTRSRISVAADATRVILGLSLGAGLALLGAPLLAPSGLPAGFSILFVPLGVLLTALASPSAREGWRFLQIVLPSLPLAFAVARAGCLIAGCCLGAPAGVPWAVAAPDGHAALHPVAMYEMVLLVALHAVLRKVRIAPRAALSIGGIGLIRLALDPMRAQSAGEPLLAACWVALTWVLVGLAMLAASGVRAAWHFGPGEAVRRLGDSEYQDETRPHVSSA
jgi:hypothetical protein